MEISEWLEAAADALERRGWSQGCNDPSGKLCVVEALEHTYVESEWGDTRQALTYIARQFEPNISNYALTKRHGLALEDRVQNWNDFEAESASQVIDTLRWAAKAAKEDEWPREQGDRVKTSTWLESAADYIEEHGWVRGHMAHAGRVCLLGALWSTPHTSLDDWGEAMGFVAEELGVDPKRLGRVGFLAAPLPIFPLELQALLSTWNDHQAKNASHVVDVLRRAAKHARHAEAGGIE
jgi:hypothetical protein